MSVPYLWKISSSDGAAATHRTRLNKAERSPKIICRAMSTMFTLHTKKTLRARARRTARVQYRYSTGTGTGIREDGAPQARPEGTGRTARSALPCEIMCMFHLSVYIYKSIK